MAVKSGEIFQGYNTSSPSHTFHKPMLQLILT